MGRLRKVSRETGPFLRLLTVHDDHTRESLRTEVCAARSGPHVARMLDYLAQLRGRPASLFTDNGPEFSQALHLDSLHEALARAHDRAN